MSKFKLTTILIALFALSVSFGLAQADDDGFNSYSPFYNLQSKDTPAGFVNEPGSQLIYLLDTGINAEEMFGDDVDFTQNSLSDYGYDAPINQNWISLTNTNPSHAVTVHFRYFNSECVDFFDFLVVLTCNDTMMVDPFNFVVPGTDDINVRDRFFTGGSFDAIPASTFDDGRFLLFVTASADIKPGYAPNLYNHGTDEDYAHMDLIPYEFIGYREEMLSVHCDAWVPGSGGAAGERIRGWGGLYSAYGNTQGFSDDNLHILNASAISFNYLIGFQAVAKVTDAGSQAAYMTQAGTRPAIWATSHYETSITGGPSGVGGFNAPLHVLLTGGENLISTAGGTTDISPLVVDGEVFMLRQEAHGGDQWDRGPNATATNWIVSEGGALGWEIFPTAAMPPEKQVVNFISFMDNYNGLSNLAQAANIWDDLSYNIQPVVTIYNLEAFNNSEDPWTPGDPEDQPIVSPVTPVTDPITAIAVKCISTYQIDPESNINDSVLGEKFGEFTLQDLFDINDVLGTGNKNLEGFMGVLAGSDNELVNEVGPGWIRFSRWFTTRHWTTIDDEPIYTTQTWQGWDDGPQVEWVLGPSIFTAGQANYVFENFGAGKWLSTVAGYSQKVSTLEREPFRIR